MDDLSQLRGLLDTPWEPGDTGRALVFADGTSRIWRTVAGGDPHHQGALELLDIPTESVAAYIVIEPDGAVTDWRWKRFPARSSWSNRWSPLTSACIARQTTMHGTLAIVRGRNCRPRCRPAHDTSLNVGVGAPSRSSRGNGLAGDARRPQGLPAGLRYAPRPS
jgi:hypothetical protein